MIFKMFKTFHCFFTPERISHKYKSFTKTTNNLNFSATYVHREGPTPQADCVAQRPLSVVHPPTMPDALRSPPSTLRDRHEASSHLQLKTHNWLLHNDFIHKQPRLQTCIRMPGGERFCGSDGEFYISCFHSCLIKYKYFHHRLGLQIVR